MKNSKINQELEDIINLMGEDVSFEFQDKYHSQRYKVKWLTLFWVWMVIINFLLKVVTSLLLQMLILKF